MDSKMLKGFVAFLQQKYGAEPRPISNREPVSVKIPMFQRTGEDEPQLPGLPGLGGMGGMGDFASLLGGGQAPDMGMGAMDPMGGGMAQDPMAAGGMPSQLMDPRVN